MTHGLDGVIGLLQVLLALALQQHGPLVDGTAGGSRGNSSFTGITGTINTVSHSSELWLHPKKRNTESSPRLQSSLLQGLFHLNVFGLKG